MVNCRTSKLSVSSVWGSIKELLADANGEKKRNFRFSGTVKLPNVPRPRMSICILPDAADINRAKQIELEYMSDKKLVKKLAKKYDLLMATETLIKQNMLIVTLARKFPTSISHAEDLNNNLTEVRSTIKFQLKKVLCFDVAVGHVQMK
ncbi:ribosomal protein L1 [Rickenella mellea]|uniref:Ribosomal protein L1 n=1 Tax=Rickenella mellea TaxID=50990 RepID=A0A4Y7PES1_9AGAM|nr:ribosomal protein L1 [Rickenella mellea]